MANYNLDNFEKLCYRAKELIFDVLEKLETSYFFSVDCIDDDILEHTPIEQIFEVVNKLNLLRFGKSLELLPQKQILVNNKRYVVDFLITDFIVENQEFELKKQLVIELDGKEYHSNKKQTNYDYARENDLKLAGYDIMRFTGSQVYNNPYDCIQQAYEYVLTLLKKDEVQ